MSTDRELLELAAKAAGIKAKWFRVTKWKDTGTSKISTGKAEVFGIHHGKPWNPLTEDGDALRLAVKLDIPISPESCNGTVWICRGDLQIFEALGVDSSAAVRRAIVRAAAEIGRTMP